MTKKEWLQFQIVGMQGLLADCPDDPILAAQLTERIDDMKRELADLPDEQPDPTGIRIIREPSVYLVGWQMVDDQEMERFLDDHHVEWQTDTTIGAEELAETAGRLCYMSFANPRPGGNSAYLRHILEVGHGSVTEHAVWNFIFTGISRSLSHELVRHRAGMSYSQLSQRFVDESVAEYVEPDCIANVPHLHAQWLQATMTAHRAYVKLANDLMDTMHFNTGDQPGDHRQRNTEIRKAARQAARNVLPNCTETKIFVTANARALRHFIELRGTRHADTEIRKLAIAILRIMQKESPNLFGDYQIVPLADGTFEATTEFRKV